RRAPFFNVLNSVKVPTNTHPPPIQRLDPSRERVLQPLLRHRVAGRIKICHKEILARSNKPTMAPQNVLMTARRSHLNLRRVPDS
ncbi:hypothetical protein A2U01_0076134, partial [Trifolium medium]|nr:hypothetical protein [Trifolium medium]